MITVLCSGSSSPQCVWVGAGRSLGWQTSCTAASPAQGLVCSKINKYLWNASLCWLSMFAQGEGRRPAYSGILPTRLAPPSCALSTPSPPPM